jgi:hypothetical protein
MAFYHEHPEKKRHQNRKRYLRTTVACADGRADPNDEPPAPIVRHVRVLVSLIEGRRVGLDEIVAMLAKKGRQHRMVGRRRSGYVTRWIDGRGS